MPLFGLFGPPNVKKLKAEGDVQGLIKALSYQKDITVRTAAAQALGEIGDARAIEPLTTALKDKSDTVREKAVKALGEIGDARAIEPLTTALKDKSDTVRAEAATALGMIPDIQKLKANRDIEGLIKALTYKKDWGIQVQAAEALGQLGDARAAGPLIAILRDPATRYMQLRSAAEKALAQFGDVRVVGEKRSTEVSAGGLQSSSKQDRHEHPEVTKRIADLKHSDYFTRRFAAEELGELGDVRAVEPLIKAVLDKDPSVRETAVDALKKLNPNWVELKAARQIIATFIAALKDGDTLDRERAARMLGRIGGAQAVEPLILALTDKVQEVQRYAAEALTRIDPNWMKSKAAEQAVPSLIAALSAEDNDTQRGAARVLGQIGDARAAEPLIAKLSNIDWMETKKHTTVDRQRQLSKWEIQGAVIRALGELGDVLAVKPLVALLIGKQFSTADTMFMAQFYTDFLIQALQKSLERRGTEIVSEDLFQIAHLPTLNFIRVVGDACGDAVTSKTSVDCADLKQLARQELIRRGEQA